MIIIGLLIVVIRCDQWVDFTDIKFTIPDINTASRSCNRLLAINSNTLAEITTVPNLTSRSGTFQCPFTIDKNEFGRNDVKFWLAINEHFFENQWHCLISDVRLCDGISNCLIA